MKSFEVFVTGSQRSFTEKVGYQALGALGCGFVPRGREAARHASQQSPMYHAVC